MDKIYALLLSGELKSYIDAAAYLIAGASIIANKTKTDKDNRAVGFLSKTINFLALNLDKVVKSANSTKYNQ